MSDPTEAETQFLDAVRQGQRVIGDGVGAWATSVERLSIAYAPVPEPPAQREFARSLFEAAAPAFHGSATPEGDGPATPPPTHG